MIQTLTPVLLLITSVFMYVSLIKPWFQETESVLAETAEYEVAAQNYARYAETLIAKKVIISSLTPRQQDRLAQILPPNINDVSTLVDLEAMAKEENMLFGNIGVLVNDRTSTENPDGLGLRELDINFEVIGTYEQFKSFLKKIESSLSLYEVVDVSFQGMTPDTVFIQFAVTLRTYALK